MHQLLSALEYLHKKRVPSLRTHTAHTIDPHVPVHMAFRTSRSQRSSVLNLDLLLNPVPRCLIF